MLNTASINTALNVQIHKKNVLFNPSSCLVPVTFSWKYGGQSVFVTGTFDEWKATTPLTIGADGVFSKTIVVNRKEPHFFKFVVDGQWCFDMELPHETDEQGNVNNVLDVIPVVEMPKIEPTFVSPVVAPTAEPETVIPTIKIDSVKPAVSTVTQPRPIVQKKVTPILTFASTKLTMTPTAGPLNSTPSVVSSIKRTTETATPNNNTTTNVAATTSSLKQAPKKEVKTKRRGRK